MSAICRCRWNPGNATPVVDPTCDTAATRMLGGVLLLLLVTALLAVALLL